MAEDSSKFRNPGPKAEPGASARVPVEDTILMHLGRACYSFGYLEKQVTDCVAKISGGKLYKRDFQSSKNLAKRLKKLAANHGLIEVSKQAEWFGRLIDERNDFLHATPVTANGRQLLQRNGLWDESRFERTSDAFATCSMKLNSWYYS